MSKQTQQPSASGLCWRCNYPLHSAFKRQCPECGRPFDPNDPRTMNMGPAIGRVTRFFVSATGWPTIALAMLATAALLWVTGLPVLILRVGVDELVWMMNVTNWRQWFDDPGLLTQSQWITLVCLILWSLIVLACGFRWMIRAWVRLRYGRCFDLYCTRRTRLLYVPALFVITACLLLCAWPSRVANAWVRRQIAGWSVAITNGQTNYTFVNRPGGTPAGSRFSMPAADELIAECPLDLPQDERLAIILHAVHAMRDPRDRVAALSMMIAWDPVLAADQIARLLEGETDPTVRVALVRLLALFQRERDLNRFAALLNDPDAQLSASAADAIGILCWPHDLHVYSGFYYPFTLPVIKSDPPICITPVFRDYQGSQQLPPLPNEWGNNRELAFQLTDAQRSALEQMMLQGRTREQREAAARVLVHFPPKDYKLRVAEWGVWLAEGSDLKLSKAIIDEIPPFVHRTGNPAAELDDRLIYPSVVTKPIIHLYASSTMPVDVKVLIRLGRPWFAFPRPDDFHFRPEIPNNSSVGTSVLQQFDPKVPNRLDPIAEGIPWIHPAHERRVAGRNIGYLQVSHIGLRWQSAVVSKERPPGATHPSVGDDARFKWWTRLREVPSDYVTSCGETERFLYYDGPTLSPAPLMVTMQGSQLQIEAVDGSSLPDNARWRVEWYRLQGMEQLHERRALYIKVDDSMRAELINLPAKASYSYPIERPKMADADEVRDAFQRLLSEAGLTKAEADGLIDAWAPHLFHTPGRRLLVRLTRADYDRLCPIEVKPVPTEMVRVGLILYEFPQERSGGG